MVVSGAPDRTKSGAPDRTKYHAIICDMALDMAEAMAGLRDMLFIFVIE